jgi:hypothetical protein
LLFAVSLLAVAAGAGGEEAFLDVVVSGEHFRVGDRVSMTVAARGGEDLLWGEPRLADETESRWALVDGPREISGTRPPAWELVVAPLELGDLELPSPLAVVRSPDGATLEVSAREFPSVTVASVLPSEGEAEPQPLRDPIGVSGFPWEWVLPLVGLIGLPLLGALAAVFFASRRLLGEAAPWRRPAATPLQEFEELLERLEGRVGREPPEGVCDRLASGLRHYLQRQSGEPAEDMTSFELRLLARQSGWPERVQRGIQTAMAMADRVRFGRRPADDAELRNALKTVGEAARTIDEVLTPDEDEAAGEAVG